MKNYSSLKQYLQLSLHEKLQVGLLPSAGMKLPRSFRQEKMVDVKKMDKRKLLKFAPNTPNFYLRESVSQRLLQAAELFAQKGIYIKVHEMYRSLKKQTKEFKEINAEMKQRHAGKSPNFIWQKTTEFIADPKMLPPHCTGAAIDIELVDRKGPLKMGTPVNAIDEKANLIATGLTKSEQLNRQLLLSVMMSQGFAPLSAEWWHFSYGDRNWAAFYNAQILYNVIDK